MNQAQNSPKKTSLRSKLARGVLLALGALPLVQPLAAPQENMATPDTAAAATGTNIPPAPSWLPATPPVAATDGSLPVTSTMPTTTDAGSPLSAALAVQPLVQPIGNKVTVAEMGQPNGLTLGGGQLESGIMFTVPSDQVTTNAKLSLALKISPALIARDTTL